MKQLETLRASMEAGYLLEYHNLVDSQVVNQDFICQAMDGQKTVAEIVATCKLPKNRIIRQLRDSMKEGVITAESL